MSALSRKVRGDLRRHRGKNLLIVGTLALAIASFAIVAVPGLLNAAMQGEVRQARLADVAVATRDLDLSPAQLAALGHLPNVAAFEPPVEYSTVAASTVSGSRRNAILWGVNLGHWPTGATRAPQGSGTRQQARRDTRRNRHDHTGPGERDRPQPGHLAERQRLEQRRLLRHRAGGSRPGWRVRVQLPGLPAL